jgi:adenosylcobinamide-GDP ribazoletransferase
MKKEFTIFLTALMFFTRIPCPSRDDFEERDLQECMRYFSLIGILIGIIGFVTFYFLQFILPLHVAIILSLVATVITTGALHEDGFADMVDGFGGGWDKEKTLTIMKDSHIGAFGVIGLILLFLLKASLLIPLLVSKDAFFIAGIFICMHSISRAAAATLMMQLDYIREGNSKARPLTGNIDGGNLYLLIALGFFPLLLFLPYWQLFFAGLGPFLVAFLLGLYMKKKIGGYTGDCLGAAQQIGEIIFLMAISLALHHL